MKCKCEQFQGNGKFCVICGGKFISNNKPDYYDLNKNPPIFYSYIN